MKKIISLALAVLMIIGICGCKSNNDDLSSITVETIYEEVVLDENGNEISSVENPTSSQQSTTSTETPDTSSNTSSDTNGNTVSTDVYIDYDTVVEIDICDDIVRGYLDSKTVEQQYYWLSTYTVNNTRYDHQNLSLDWKMDLSSEYTVYFSENSDFSNPIILKTDSGRELKNAILIPGKTYYWKAIGNTSDAVLGGGKIKLKDAPVRFIYVHGIRNVRDMGGWKTESGKTVKYEMLYRGQQLDNIKAEGLATLKQLGIKTEFDIRHDSQNHSETEGTDFNYYYMSTATSYKGLFSSGNKTEITNNYKKMFEILSDSSNYPIYTHCQGGSDRTGTFAFLLNGLLGVPYEDLLRDFELTSFCGQKRWRSEGNGGTFNKADADMKDGGVTVTWREMYNGMMDYGSKNGCTTLQQSIEHWFINYVGVPQEQIDSFKSIMLE